MDNEFDKLKEALDKIKPNEFEWTSDPATMGFSAQETGETVDNTKLTTVDLSTLSGLFNGPIGNITISGASGSGSILTSSGSNGTYWTTNTGPYTIGAAYPNNKSTLDVNGDANFEGDIKWKGRSLGQLLETIEKRLAILTPNPDKLEHFEALQKAYKHYKTLEALCEVPTKDDNS